MTRRRIPPRPKRAILALQDPKELEPALSAELKRLQLLYERRPEALLHAVDFILRFYFSESWVCEAFARRFEAWCRWQIPDLAQAFGVKRKSKNSRLQQQREDLRVPVVSAIVEYRRCGMVQEEAIERTAKDFKVSESFVAKLYHGNPRIRKIVENLPPLRFRLVENAPRLHARRRKSRTS